MRQSNFYYLIWLSVILSSCLLGVLIFPSTCSRSPHAVKISIKDHHSGKTLSSLVVNSTELFLVNRGLLAHDTANAKSLLSTFNRSDSIVFEVEQPQDWGDSTLNCLIHVLSYNQSGSSSCDDKYNIVAAVVKNRISLNGAEFSILFKEKSKYDFFDVKGPVIEVIDVTNLLNLSIRKAILAQISNYKEVQNVKMKVRAFSL